MTKMHFGRSKKPLSRKILTGVELTSDCAVQLAHERLGARICDLRRYAFIPVPGMGQVALVNQRGTKGYNLFSPNGTPESQPYRENMQDAKVKARGIGREVLAEFYELERNIAGFTWASGSSHAAR